LASETMPASGQPSVMWRVVGEYSSGGVGYVLLAESDGRLRSVVNESFRGESLRVEGVVDGQRVATWTGGGSGQGPMPLAGAHK
jgi:zona occludens toxin